MARNTALITRSLSAACRPPTASKYRGRIGRLRRLSPWRSHQGSCRRAPEARRPCCGQWTASRPRRPPSRRRALQWAAPRLRGADDAREGCGGQDGRQAEASEQQVPRDTEEEAHHVLGECVPGQCRVLQQGPSLSVDGLAFTGRSPRHRPERSLIELGRKGAPAKVTRRKYAKYYFIPELVTLSPASRVQSRLILRMSAIHSIGIGVCSIAFER